MSSYWVFSYNHSRSKTKKKEDNFSLACLLQSFYSFRENVWLMSFCLQKRTHWMSSVTLCIFEGAGRSDDQETMSLLTYRCHQASWHRYKGGSVEHRGFTSKSLMAPPPSVHYKWRKTLYWQLRHVQVHRPHHGRTPGEFRPRQAVKIRWTCSER